MVVKHPPFSKFRKCSERSKNKTRLSGYLSNIVIPGAQETVNHLVYARPFGWPCFPTIFHNFPQFAIQSTTGADSSWRAGWPGSLHHLPDYRSVFGNLEERNTAGEYLRVHEPEVCWSVTLRGVVKSASAPHSKRTRMRKYLWLSDLPCFFSGCP